MATARSVRISVYGASGATPSAPAWQWQDGKVVQVQPLASGDTFEVPAAGLG